MHSVVKPELTWPRWNITKPAKLFSMKLLIEVTAIVWELSPEQELRKAKVVILLDRVIMIHPSKREHLGQQIKIWCTPTKQETSDFLDKINFWYYCKEHTFSFNLIPELSPNSCYFFEIWPFVYKIVSGFSGIVILRNWPLKSDRYRYRYRL